MPQLLIYLLIDILIFAVIAYALYWVCTHFFPNLPPCTVDLRRRAADRCSCLFISGQLGSRLPLVPLRSLVILLVRRFDRLGRRRRGRFRRQLARILGGGDEFLRYLLRDFIRLAMRGGLHETVLSFAFCWHGGEYTNFKAPTRATRRKFKAGRRVSLKVHLAASISLRGTPSEAAVKTTVRVTDSTRSPRRSSVHGVSVRSRLSASIAANNGEIPEGSISSGGLSVE